MHDSFSGYGYESDSISGSLSLFQRLLDILVRRLDFVKLCYLLLQFILRQVRCPCDRCDARATDSNFLSVKFNAHTLTYVFPLVIVIIFRLLLLPSFFVFGAVFGQK